VRRPLKLLNSENHIGENVGDANPLIRADFEDALVQTLEDVLVDGKLDAFRSFLRGRWGREFPAAIVEMCLSQDSWAYYTVYYYSCTLRRMMARWEHCANKLMVQYGMDPAQIPPGTEWLEI